MILSQHSQKLLGSLAFLISFGIASSSYAVEEAPLDKQEPVGSDTLSGDWGRWRSKLYSHGFAAGATEMLEIYGNPSGGSTQGATVFGRFDMYLDFDFEKMAGVKGLTGHVNAYQFHGRGMSASNLNNNLMVVTGEEATSGSMLFDLWLQQNFLDDNLSIRFGQIAADDEFTVSEAAGLYVNSEFGWPNVLATDLTGGGPAFPLATPGIRFQIGKSEPWAFRAAVFDGDPSAKGKNGSGTAFNTQQGALIMGEGEYNNKGEKTLSGTYKAGFWYHTENFNDPRTDNTGLSLADPASTGVARVHRGNYGFYGIADQTLWHKPNTEDGGLVGFARFFWAPENRNVGHYEVDAGLNYKGLFSSRPDDTLGIGFSYLAISGEASKFDRETNSFNATNAPVRDYESLIEITYLMPVLSWFSVQPDFQYIMHPGGNVVDPNDPAGVKPIEDAVVIGVRFIGNL